MAMTQRKIEEGSDNFGVQGWWIESREDRGGCGVLELGREGAKRQRGTGWQSALLNTLGAWQREKEGEGVGSVPRGGRRGAKRVGPGCSDSGGRRTLHGRGGRARTGEAAGARDVGAAAGCGR
jgi:hypothetical protein